MYKYSIYEIKDFVKSLRELHYVKGYNGEVVGTRIPSREELTAAAMIDQLLDMLDKANETLEYCGY